MFNVHKQIILCPPTPICSIAVRKTESLLDLSKDTQRNLCEVETGNEMLVQNLIWGSLLVGWHTAQTKFFQSAPIPDSSRLKTPFLSLLSIPWCHQADKSSSPLDKPPMGLKVCTVQCSVAQVGTGRLRADMDHWRLGDGWSDSVTVFTDEVDTDLEQRAIIIT